MTNILFKTPTGTQLLPCAAHFQSGGPGRPGGGRPGRVRTEGWWLGTAYVTRWAGVSIQLLLRYGVEGAGGGGGGRASSQTRKSGSHLCAAPGLRESCFLKMVTKLDEIIEFIPFQPWGYEVSPWK